MILLVGQPLQDTMTGVRLTKPKTTYNTKPTVALTLTMSASVGAVGVSAGKEKKWTTAAECLSGGGQNDTNYFPSNSVFLRAVEETAPQHERMRFKRGSTVVCSSLG